MALINPATTAITSKSPSACLAIPEASGKPDWPPVLHRGQNTCYAPPGATRVHGRSHPDGGYAREGRDQRSARSATDVPNASVLTADSERRPVASVRRVAARRSRTLGVAAGVLTHGGRRRPAIYLACPAAVRRRLAVIASHSDTNKMTIPSRACSPPIHLLFSPAAASAV
jgi:hypothetical protein